MIRRLARFLVPCILALVPAAAAHAAAPRAQLTQLTLEEAVRLALATNERALQAPLRVEAAEGQLERTRAAFMPTLVTGATGTLRFTPDRSGRLLSANGFLSLNVPIIDPPAFPARAQARHQLEAERWGAVEDRRLVAYDTARAFLVVLTSERVLEVAARRLERARTNQQNAEARAAAQLASVNDVTLALSETASAARQVAQAEGSVARAYLQLSYAVGQPVTGPLVSPDRTTRAAESGALRGEAAVRGAEARRADVRAAEERTAALREAAKEPLYRLAPTLEASAQVRVTPAPVAPEPWHDESVQLTLSWTLFDGGARYADRRVRLAQAESQALTARQLKRSIASDVDLAAAALRTAREAYRITREEVEAARRNTAETEILYQQGLARAFELVEANTRRFEAEVNRETARLNMEQAYLELRFALGLDPLDGGAQPAQPPQPAQPAQARPGAAAPQGGAP